MEYIIGKRNTGKTTRLLQKTEDNNGILVVANLKLKKYWLRRTRLHSNQILTWNEVMNGHLKGRHAPVYLDDVDLILCHFIDNLKGMSFSE